MASAESQTSLLKDIIQIIEKIIAGDFGLVIKPQGHGDIYNLYESLGNLIIKLRNDEKINAEQLQTMEKAQFEIKEAIYVNNVSKKLIEQQLLELKEVDQQKDEFASMVSHELKTPLVPIMGYTEMLKDPEFSYNLTEEQREYVREIDENAKRLEILINDVLDVQKLAMGKMTLSFTEIDTEQIITNTINDLISLAKQKDIQIVNNSIKNVKFSADVTRLRQIFDNLVKNAVDFVPEKTGKIEIGFNDHDSYIDFFVKDNGVGIPINKQQNLFRKFYQVDSTQTRQHGGTGLGLVICKGIIEAMDGKIWVISEEGKGAVFFFRVKKSEK